MTYGITFNIQGTPGSTGTVSTAVLTENPQPNAAPAGVSLTRFISVIFYMDAADFTQAQIIIPYTDSDIQGLQEPYSIYKYVPATDTYTQIPAVIDANAKTFTITVNSVEDPIFAIGGASNCGSNQRCFDNHVGCTCCICSSYCDVGCRWRLVF